MQAPLTPLVIDALVQTEIVSRKNETCQTEKSTGIECAVQADLARRTFGTQTKVENVEITRIDAIVQTDGSSLKNTQTIKVENDEIAMPNIPSSSSSKIDKKRKICSSKTPPQVGLHDLDSNLTTVLDLGTKLSATRTRNKCNNKTI